MNSHLSITHYGVVSLNDSAFIIGGNCDADYSSQISKVSFFNDRSELQLTLYFQYTVASDRWSVAGNLLTPRSGHRAILKLNRANVQQIHVIGGNRL